MTANGVDARRDDAAAWLAVRDHLRSRRLLLSAAASASYPDHQKVERTDLLTRPVWFPQSPVPLAAIGIELQGDATPPIFSGLEAEAAASLPTVNGAAGHGGYSQAMAELARPTVFEDRPVYRLLEADLAGPSPSLRSVRAGIFRPWTSGRPALTRPQPPTATVGPRRFATSLATRAIFHAAARHLPSAH